MVVIPTKKSVNREQYIDDTNMFISFLDYPNISNKCLTKCRWTLIKHQVFFWAHASFHDSIFSLGPRRVRRPKVRETFQLAPRLRLVDLWWFMALGSSKTEVKLWCCRTLGSGAEKKKTQAGKLDHPISVSSWNPPDQQHADVLMSEGGELQFVLKIWWTCLEEHGWCQTGFNISWTFEQCSKFLY